MFNFSGYPIDSKYYDSTNKNVLGKIKDEFNGVKIVEFVGLKMLLVNLLKQFLMSAIIVRNEEVFL